jgi:putative oxidoreductase
VRKSLARIEFFWDRCASGYLTETWDFLDPALRARPGAAPYYPEEPQGVIAHPLEVFAMQDTMQARTAAVLRMQTARDLALLVLRGIAGFTMAWHGWQKIDGGVGGFKGFVESLGLPFPGLLAPVVTALEFGGGILLILGLLTRLWALLIGIEMAFTAFLVKATKLDVGFIGAEGAGYELDLLILAACVALLLLGPGRVSLDTTVGVEPIERRWRRT